MIISYYDKVSASEIILPLLNYNVGFAFIPLLFYSIDKAIREQVFHRWEIKQRLKCWKELFNSLPVGLAVVKGESITYTNSAIMSLFHSAITCNESLNDTLGAINKNDEHNLLDLFKKVKKRDSITTLFDILTAENDLGQMKGENFDIKINENDSTPLAVSTVKYKIGTEQLKIVSLQDLSIYEELDKKRNLLEYQKTFFAMITHELRNPLHGIMGVLELIKNSNVTEKCIRDCFIGLNTGKLMMCLINDILDFSQMEANKFKLNEDTFSCITTLNECLDVMNFRFEEKHIKLQKKITGPIPESIRNDKNRYKQIVFNLLGNALKFTNHGYTEIEISYDVRKKMLVTKVTDTGNGIKDDDKASLFQMYGKLDSHKKINPQGTYPIKILRRCWIRANDLQETHRSNGR